MRSQMTIVVNGKKRAKNKLFESWVIFHSFLSSADFFQNQIFQKFFQEYHQSGKQFVA